MALDGPDVDGFDVGTLGSPRSRRALALALAIGGAAAIAATPISPDLTTAGRYALATTYFAAVLWVTGALPLPVTALLVPVVLTTFGVYPEMDAAVAGFADPVVFLLLAGFVLAAALQTHGVDRRVAYVVLARFGTSPRRLVAGLMAATALLSMLVSNTATVAMMVPIAVGLVDEVTEVSTADTDGASNLQIAALLGVAYAASIGGVGTLVGTPPNAIVVGQLGELVGVRLSFVDWLAVGLPVVAVTLPLAWALLVYVVYPPETTDVSAARARAREQLARAGPLSPAARRTVAVFAATAGLWLLGGLGFLFRGLLPPAWYTTLFGGPGPSVFGPGGHQGVLYFVVVGLLAVPALVLSGAVEWEDLLDVDWPTLVLLGGGIALADALRATGATEWLAGAVFGRVGGASLVVVLVVVMGLVVLVGELASNTAMAAIVAPLLVNVGPAYADALGTTGETAAVFLAVAGGVAASFGFALPVATPPNAIAFGSGYVRRDDMLRAGVLLDVAVVLATVGVVWLLVRTVWPIVLG